MRTLHEIKDVLLNKRDRSPNPGNRVPQERGRRRGGSQNVVSGEDSLHWDCISSKCSKFQRFKVSKIENPSISCFFKILPPYSRFWRSYRTVLQDVSVNVYQGMKNLRTNVVCNALWFPKRYLWQCVELFSLIAWSNMVSPELYIIGLGGHGHARKVRTSLKNITFWSLENEA